MSQRFAGHKTLGRLGDKPPLAAIGGETRVCDVALCDRAVTLAVVEACTPAGYRFTPFAVDSRTKPEQNEPGTTEGIPMTRFAKDSLALASVVGFVWMVCQAAQFVA